LENRRVFRPWPWEHMSFLQVLLAPLGAGAGHPYV
jgi:hypothetical protein